MRHKAASYIGRSSYVGWPSTAPLSHLRSTSGRFAPTSHLPHPVAVIAFAAWSGSVLFFSFFVRCFLLHRYFDTRKLWWCMEAGAGGQIQYISRRKVCQYTENWTICERISRIALYALIGCYMLLFRVISYSKNFLNYACFTFAPVWNIMGAYMIEV